MAASEQAKKDSRLITTKVRIATLRRKYKAPKNEFCDFCVVLYDKIETAKDHGFRDYALQQFRTHVQSCPVVNTEAA